MSICIKCTSGTFGNPRSKQDEAGNFFNVHKDTTLKTMYNNYTLIQNLFSSTFVTFLPRIFEARVLVRNDRYMSRKRAIMLLFNHLGYPQQTQLGKLGENFGKISILRITAITPGLHFPGVFTCPDIYTT